MAGPVDIELEDGDIKIVAGAMSLLDGAERVAQSVEIRLKALRGEWFLNRAFGVAYFEGILGGKMTTRANYDSVVKAAILEVNGVNRILAFESTFTRPTRVYSVSFTADTIYGPITYTGVLP